MGEIQFIFGFSVGETGSWLVKGDEDFNSDSATGRHTHVHQVFVTYRICVKSLISHTCVALNGVYSEHGSLSMSHLCVCEQ